MVQLRNLRRKIRCLKAPTSFSAHSLLNLPGCSSKQWWAEIGPSLVWGAFTWVAKLIGMSFDDVRWLYSLRCFWSRRIFQMSVAHEAKPEVGHSQPQEGSEECCYVEELEHALICFNGIVRIMSEFHLSIIGHFVEFRIHNSFQNVRNKSSIPKDEHKLKRIQPCICLQPADVSPTHWRHPPRSLQLPNWAPLSASHNELPFWLAKPGSLRDLLVQS